MDYRQEINAIKDGIFLKIPVVYSNKHVSHDNLEASDPHLDDDLYKESIDSVSLFLGGKKIDFEFEVTSNVSFAEDGYKLDEIYVNGGFKGEHKIIAEITSYKVNGEHITYCSTGNAEIDMALKARHAAVNSDQVSVSDSGQDTWVSSEDLNELYPELYSSVTPSESQLKMEVGVHINSNEQLETVRNYFEEQYPNLDFEKSKNVIELMKKSRVNSNKMLSILSKFSGEAQANIIYFGLKKSPEELHKFIDKNYERLFPELTGLQPKARSTQMSL